MIHFTKHALEKFKILRTHKFFVKKETVVKTVQNPDVIDLSRWPFKIAQRKFDKRRVLRVVYKVERGDKIIITFYPGKIAQYEKTK